MTVAVCARAQAPGLTRCLDALRAAGASPIVFHAPAGRGLSEPRNAALDAARRSDVLALLDDDVIVPEGWLAALHDAWATAGDHCACIGGPIDATFRAPRPAWLTDAFLSVLGAGASGSTLRGGNASFRVEALLGVGGFWPAAGRPELRDWFTEEHHAQRELAAAGWSSREAPELRATREIDPVALGWPNLLALRARYGARNALVGAPRGRAAAARSAAVSAAGAAIALARRDGASAAERAGRAAEGVGGLLPGRLAVRDLQPGCGATPFRHAIPQPPRRRPRVRRRTAPLVFVYHRVGHEVGADVEPQVFAEQMQLLADQRTPVTVDAIACGECPPDAVAVTFDDAYAETLHHAAPALHAAGVPATVYAVTAHTTGQGTYWWDEIGPLLASRQGFPLRLTIDGETRAWADGSAAATHLPAWLQPKLPEAIETAMDDLRAWAGVGTTPAAGPHRALSVEETKAAAAAWPLITFGAHTRTHPNLRFVSKERRRAELEGSRDDLAQWLGTPPTGLAYPFGLPDADVDEATRRAAEAAGFRYAVVNQAGVVGVGVDRFALPRLAPPASADEEFLQAIRRS